MIDKNDWTKGRKAATMRPVALESAPVYTNRRCAAPFK